MRVGPATRRAMVPRTPLSAAVAGGAYPVAARPRPRRTAGRRAIRGAPRSRTREAARRGRPPRPGMGVRPALIIIRAARLVGGPTASLMKGPRNIIPCKATRRGRAPRPPAVRAGDQGPTPPVRRHPSPRAPPPRRARLRAGPPLDAPAHKPNIKGRPARPCGPARAASFCVIE